VLALDVFCFVDLYRADEVGYLIFGRKRHVGLGLT
jgi:hypothetical protein